MAVAREPTKAAREKALALRARMVPRRTIRTHTRCMTPTASPRTRI